jgi:hypothetical protein
MLRLEEADLTSSSEIDEGVDDESEAHESLAEG